MTSPLSPSRPRPSRKPPLGRPFWLVWSAAAIAYVGEGLYLGALPLLAASLTHDPSAISFTTVMSRAGWLLVGLLSGVLVDRWSKTQVMWRADALRAAAIGVFAVLALTGHVTMAVIYLASLLLGVVAPFFDNAAAAVLPRIVDKENLERANSWDQTASLAGVTLLGPPAGAALFVWSPTVPLWLQAAAFAVSAVLIATVRGRVDDPAAVATEARSLRRELVDGLSYLARHRLLRTLALLLMAINGATGVVVSLLVLYNLEVLGYPEAAYGWLVAVFAVGGLGGAAAVPWLKARLGTFAAVVTAAAGFAVGTLLLGALPVWPAVLAGIVVTGVGSSLWNVITMALRQRIVPSELLGRVTGAYRMASMGAVPVGAAAGGLLAAATSVQTAYLVAGAFIAVATLAAAAPLRRGLREVAEADELAAAEIGAAAGRR